MAKKPTKKVEKKKEDVVDPKEHTQAIEVVREVLVKEPTKELTHVSELKIDKPKIELIKRTIAKGATDDELMMFLNVCKGLGLSPFIRHVHFVKRWDSKTGTEIGAVQVGIDGFRSIAESTGAYAGNSDPVFGKVVTKKCKTTKKDYNSGKEVTTESEYEAPEFATVTVRKVVQGQPYDFTATARWDEFYPGDKQGFMWRTKPHIMLGKCAEGQALRKAFPKVLSGVYTPEELEQAGQKPTTQSVEDKMDKALAMIAQDTDIKRMSTYLKKVQASDAYTDEQKFEIQEAVNKRVKELMKDGDDKPK